MTETQGWILVAVVVMFGMNTIRHLRYLSMDLGNVGQKLDGLIAAVQDGSPSELLSVAHAIRSDVETMKPKLRHW